MQLCTRSLRLPVAQQLLARPLRSQCRVSCATGSPAPSDDRKHKRSAGTVINIAQVHNLIMGPTPAVTPPGPALDWDSVPIGAEAKALLQRRGVRAGTALKLHDILGFEDVSDVRRLTPALLSNLRLKPLELAPLTELLEQYAEALLGGTGGTSGTSVEEEAAQEPNATGLADPGDATATNMQEVLMVMNAKPDPFDSIVEEHVVFKDGGFTIEDAAAALADYYLSADGDAQASQDEAELNAADSVTEDKEGKEEGKEEDVEEEKDKEEAKEEEEEADRAEEGDGAAPGEEEDEEDECEEREEITIRGKWMMDGACTIDQAVKMLEREIRWLKKAKAKGWELTDGICDDYGQLTHEDPTRKADELSYSSEEEEEEEDKEQGDGKED